MMDVSTWLVMDRPWLLRRRRTIEALGVVMRGAFAWLINDFSRPRDLYHYPTEIALLVPVLHSLKSPQNVGSIVRSHRAFGGTQLVFVGSEHPWRFKKSTLAFSRRLEAQLDIVYLPNDDALLDWCRQSGLSCLALEISSSATPLSQFSFPSDAAIVCGNEADGIPTSLLASCEATIVVPQSGPVGSLNVATACSIALYSYSIQYGSLQPIGGHKFVGEFPDRGNK